MFVPYKNDVVPAGADGKVPSKSGRIDEFRAFFAKISSAEGSVGRDDEKASEIAGKIAHQIIPNEYYATEEEVQADKEAAKAARRDGTEYVSKIVELKARNGVTIACLKATRKEDFDKKRDQITWAQEFWSETVPVHARQRFFKILEKKVLQQQELLEFLLQQDVIKPENIAAGEIDKGVDYIKEVQTPEAAEILRKMVLKEVPLTTAGKKAAKPSEAKALGIDSHTPVEMFGIITSFNYPLALTLAGFCRAILSGSATLFKPSQKGAEWAFAFQSIFKNAMHEFLVSERRAALKGTDEEKSQFSWISELKSGVVGHDGKRRKVDDFDFAYNLADGLFNIVIGKEVKVHEIADKTLFIGSERIGKALAAEAAKAGKQLIPDQAGANHLIIHTSYFGIGANDIEAKKANARKLAIEYRKAYGGASGQRCTKNGNCQLVTDDDVATEEEAILIAEFEKELFNGVDDWKIGGQYETVNQGPMINEQAAIEGENHVIDCLRRGAKIIIQDPMGPAKTEPKQVLVVEGHSDENERLINDNLRVGDLLSRALIVWNKDQIKNRDVDHPFGKEIFAPFSHFVSGGVSIKSACKEARDSEYRLQTSLFGSESSEMVSRATKSLRKAGVSVLLNMFGKDLSPVLAHGGLSGGAGNGSAHGGDAAYGMFHTQTTVAGDPAMVRREVARLERVYGEPSLRQLVLAAA